MVECLAECSFWPDEPFLLQLAILPALERERWSEQLLLIIFL